MHMSNMIDPNEVTIIGLDTDDDNTHELFCERIKQPVGAAFIREVTAHGVGQPVTLTEVDGKKVVVAGRRRVRAAREAGRQVPYTMQDYGDEVVRFVLAENAHRRDNSYLASARIAMRYVQGFSWPQKKVAEAMNVSQATVSKWLQLVTKGSPKVLRAVDADKLSASAAIKLCKLDHEAQDAALDAAIAEGGKITINKVEAATGDKPKKVAKKKWLEVAGWLNNANYDDIAAGIWVVFGDIEKEQFDNDEAWDIIQECLNT